MSPHSTMGRVLTSCYKKSVQDETTYCGHLGEYSLLQQFLLIAVSKGKRAEEIPVSPQMNSCYDVVEGSLEEDNRFLRNPASATHSQPFKPALHSGLFSCCFPSSECHCCLFSTRCNWESFPDTTTVPTLNPYRMFSKICCDIGSAHYVIIHSLHNLQYQALF